jgi:hypothetical protein
MESNGKPPRIKEAGSIQERSRRSPPFYKLSAEQNARFLSLYEASHGCNGTFYYGMYFPKGITNVTVDKATMDYYMRLTTLFGQFRAVGTNYNQVVKIVPQFFRKESRSLSLINWKNRQLKWRIVPKDYLLTEEFEAKYLKR